MADDHSFHYPPASGSRLLQSLSSDFRWPDESDPLFPGLYDLTEFGFPHPPPELIGETTTPFRPVPAAPEAVFASGIPAHLAAVNPTDPPQGYPPSVYEPDRGSSVGEYYNGLPGTTTAPLSALTATHGVGSSSGYDTPAAVPESATTGEPQVNPSQGLRIFHSMRDGLRSPEWRAEVKQVYSIEISQRCLGPELWAKWNGRLYINKSTYDDADALYLRIDAQISESNTIAPSKMCTKCEKKTFLRRAGQNPPQPSNLNRIYCNWELDRLEKRGDFFEGVISFHIFCHPSHTDGKKCTLQTFRMIATLYRANTTELANYILAEDIISRTTAKNNSTVRSALRNSTSFRATSPEHTTAAFVCDEGDFENDRPDAPEYFAPEIVIPRPVSEVAAPPTTRTSGPPPTPSTVMTISVPHLFKNVVPNRGCENERVELYGCVFSPTVDYYAKFGELEPTRFLYQDAATLEGVVPERGETGRVSVSIVTKEGVALYPEMHMFTYIDRGLKDMQEKIERVHGKAGSEDTIRDMNNALDRFEDRRKRNGSSSSPTRAPNVQTRQCGIVSGDETGAQDEMSKTLTILEPTSELIDVPMQHLTNQGGDAQTFLPPSRTGTNVSAATTTTAVATSWGTPSLKAIKATSRKPTSQSIVSKWLGSNYGSERSRKRKRIPSNMLMEAPVWQAEFGGSWVGSINLVLSPEQTKDTDVASGADEDIPVILMDVSPSDQQAARGLKRRRVEAPLQPLASTNSSLLP